MLEARPSESGRCCIVEYSQSSNKQDAWTARNVLPSEYSASTTIHEYGGGAFALRPDGKIIFNDVKRRGVFLLNPESAEVKPIIQQEQDIRYADFHCHPIEPWILAIQEDHTKEPCENTVVAIDTTQGEVRVVASGADFYQHPQFSPDGLSICWIQWSHPHMCWRGTQLFIAGWQSGTVHNARKIAGEEGKISVCQPRWGIDGTLYFVSDNTGWWQLYRFKADSNAAEYIRLPGLEETDFGARGQTLGACTWVPLTAESLMIAVTRNATQSLIVARPGDSSFSKVSSSITEVSFESIARLSDTEAAIIGASPTSAEAAYAIDTKSGSSQTLKTTLSFDIFPAGAAECLSTAQHISFPRVYGDHREGLAHAFYAAPKNPHFTAPDGTKPPCIMWCHGGPHSNYGSGLDLTAQYFTSRGYAYVGINHAGSIGYGRAFRELLYGEWGTIDTADCASLVKYLVDQGLADAGRIGITGGSAGGYATLQGLCEYPDVYAGGVSIYGVSSIEGLMSGMHKYESEYCQQLVFKPGISKEEEAEVLQKRSPYLNAEKIKAPLLLLQGDADTVVPESQTWLMEKVMKERGSKAEVVIFKDEGHGFKRKDTIKAALELQENWWEQTLLK